MNQLFQDSVFFGVLISLAAYGIGMLLKLKTGWSLMNPLLISIILVIITLLLTGVDYKPIRRAPTVSAICSHQPPSVWLCHFISRLSF